MQGRQHRSRLVRYQVNNSTALHDVTKRARWDSSMFCPWFWAVVLTLSGLGDLGGFHGRRSRAVPFKNLDFVHEAGNYQFV